MKTYEISETKIVATHFCNNPNRGRTTTLINAKTEEHLIELMGVSTRKACYSAYRAMLDGKLRLI